MEATLQQRIKQICVFYGSNSGNKPELIEAAKELGRVMTECNMHLVYGGGNYGLIGSISKAVQEGGGHVLRIILKGLADKQLIGQTNEDERIVSSMSEELRETVNTADAFIALPDGLGTFEEIFTVALWAHLNIHRKPIGLLNIEHFFDFLTSTKADESIDQIIAFEPKIDPILSKLDWLDSDRGKKRKLDIDLNR